MKGKEVVEGIRKNDEMEKETIVSVDGGKGILKIVANFIPKNSSECTSKHRDSNVSLGTELDPIPPCPFEKNSIKSWVFIK